MENKHSSESLKKQMAEACNKIAPLWSLENFVAVNPFMGLSHKRFESAAQDLALTGEIQMALDHDFYLDKIKKGSINPAILQKELKKSKRFNKLSVDELVKKLENTDSDSKPLIHISTLCDVASEHSEIDWARFQLNRIAFWAASYFDAGQVSWKTSEGEKNLFKAWKADAEVDRTSDLNGLKEFRATLKSFPNEALEASQMAIEQLGIAEEDLDLYLHRLLLRVGGWSAYAAKLDWDQKLDGKTGTARFEFLAILVCWEACFLNSFKESDIKADWEKAKSALSLVKHEEEINQDLALKLILQEAFDQSKQVELLNKFKKTSIKEEKKDYEAQAIFCIDVRSEIYRRNLEQVNSNIETLGFAGFFAFPIDYKPLGHDHGKAQCPALLKPAISIQEKLSRPQENEKAINNRRLNLQVEQLWKSFKTGAISCFSYVSPLGLSYLPKLISDSFAWSRPVPRPDDAGLDNKNKQFRTVEIDEEQLPLSEQINMAKNALTAMSFTENFAPFVLIAGHGSNSVNNPHASGLDCGACGGNSGEANARLAAEILNRKKVREGLAKEQIIIPEDTTFLAGLHDTSNDEITLFNERQVPYHLRKAFRTFKENLQAASQKTREERSGRLSAKADKLLSRGMDWSQVRHEWGLAGCHSFVVAPRKRTQELNLEGKTFLHNYNWKQDRGFSTLELIMSAPMVVTSWINLQYYASTVDNNKLGSGNKTLHNVTSGLGVIEGFAGDLRVGLPWQSVHDGTNFQHEPLRLSVIIEAPIEAMNQVLEKHPDVKALCDNSWINLFAMDDYGQIIAQYNKDLSWDSREEKAA